MKTNVVGRGLEWHIIVNRYCYKVSQTYHNANTCHPIIIGEGTMQYVSHIIPYYSAMNHISHSNSLNNDQMATTDSVLSSWDPRETFNCP